MPFFWDGFKDGDRGRPDFMWLKNDWENPRFDGMMVFFIICLMKVAEISRYIPPVSADHKSDWC